MKEYFIALVIISFIGGGIVMLCPCDKSRKNLRLLCSFCSIGCIMLLVVSFIKGSVISKEDISNYFNREAEQTQIYDEIYNKNLKLSEASNAERELKSLMSKEFLLDDKSFDVRIELYDKSGEFYIDKIGIIIYLNGLSINPQRLKKYVYEKTGYECEIYYDIKQ